MRRLTLSLLLTLLASTVLAQRGADLPIRSGDVTSPANAQVWVTLGEDALRMLHDEPGVLRYGAPPQALASRDGVAVVRLSAGDLDALSELLHLKTMRCPGFVVHHSFEEAQAVLDNTVRNSYRALAASFSIDQQTTVQNLLPNLDGANILSTIQHLSTNYNNRYYQNASGEQSALWIRDLWQGYAASSPGVTVTTYDHGSYVQPSVILTIPGTTLASEVVVLGGHLDSIRSGSTNSASTIAPGADDNASGIATLSEVIRVLLSNGFAPDRTVKFMGYAAEEVGLRGSADIASDHQNAGTNVVGVMQLDMTAYNGSVPDIALIDDNTNAQLSAFTGQLIDTYLPTLQWTYSTCGYGCSDHASWHNRGFPAVMPFEARMGEHNPTIHSGNDTTATFGNTADHSLKFARLALAFAVETSLAGGCTPAPVADAGADRTICQGDSTTLGTAAQSGTTYSWNPGGATSAQVSVSPSSTTTYTVTATNSCGNVQDSVTVTVDSGSGGGLTEDFEGGLGGWTISGLWHLVNNSSCASPGYSSATGSVYYGQDSSCNYSTGGGTNGDLTSPVVSGITSSSELSFDFYRQVENYASGSYDRAEVAAKATGSSTWTTLWSRDSGDASAAAWTASGPLSLAAFAGQDIQVRFRFDSVDGTANTFTGWFIDDVVITAQSACGGGNTAPNVTITAPANGTSVTQGTNVTLTGNAQDTEDGNLSSSIAWSSNLDGSLGTGASVSTSSLSVGSHTLTAQVSDSGGLSDSDTITLTVTTTAPTCAADEDFEAGSGGWVHSSSSTCVRGSFVRATPTQQSNGGVVTQVGGDHTTGSGSAFFTATNTNAGSNDVDRGNCIALSPTYSVSTASDLSIWYFHGQRDAGDDPSGDFFRLELSTDGGSTWSSLVSTGDVQINAAWTQATATVPAGSTVQLRVQASDASGAGDLVEAGVDDLTICPQ